MRYQPPIIVATLNATTTIQTQGLPDSEKVPGDVLDFSPGTINCTAAAYDADE